MVTVWLFVANIFTVCHIRSGEDSQHYRLQHNQVMVTTTSVLDGREEWLRSEDDGDEAAH